MFSKRQTITLFLSVIIKSAHWTRDCKQQERCSTANFLPILPERTFRSTIVDAYKTNIYFVGRDRWGEKNVSFRFGITKWPCCSFDCEEYRREDSFVCACHCRICWTGSLLLKISILMLLWKIIAFVYTGWLQLHGIWQLENNCKVQRSGTINKTCLC